MHNLHKSISWTSNSTKNVREHGLAPSRTAGRCNRGAPVESDAIKELHLKRTQSGSSWNGHNQGAAAEVDASVEQQLKQIHRGVAAGGDANREQQLMQPGSISWSGHNWWAEAPHRELFGAGLLTYVGELGGSSWGSEASDAACTAIYLQTLL